MELTREEIEKLASYNSATEGQTMYMDEFVARIAKQLLREMDKPKVWEGAHEWQDRARVKHYSNSALCAMDETFKDYTRTLPKSRIDEIAEECVKAVFEDKAPTVEVFKNAIKSAILKDREERGEK